MALLFLPALTLSSSPRLPTSISTQRRPPQSTATAPTPSPTPCSKPDSPPSSLPAPAPFHEVAATASGLTVLYSTSPAPIDSSNMLHVLAFIRNRHRVLLSIAPHAVVPPALLRTLARLGARLVRRSVSSKSHPSPSTSPTPTPTPTPTPSPARFQIHAPHPLAGSQPNAVRFLARGLLTHSKPFQTLAGVTGSGKTYMMASIVAQAQLPTLVLAPNKTLAAQLYNEFRAFFPHNRVEFFVSHFKFYQPEAYMPNTDKYIAKSSAIDQELDRLRHAATKSLFESNDTLVVASVSSIYGLGLPSEYLRAAVPTQIGDKITPNHLADSFRKLNYVEDPSKIESTRGHFRINQQSAEVSPPWERVGIIYRYGFENGQIASFQRVDFSSGLASDLGQRLVLYPAKHFVTPKHRLEAAIKKIESEARQCVQNFIQEGKALEATRLQDRVQADIEMMKKVGFCHGVENYSLHLSGRDPGKPPETLLDYMPADGKWLLFIDESHITVPQLGGMYAGNAARKKKLVQYGFRLPSAMENRPLNLSEFWSKAHQTIFVSATPGPFEREKSGEDGVINAVIRPTGVLDPTVEVVPTKCQIEHLTTQLAKVAANGGKAIVTTITKRFAEDVADCLAKKPPVTGVFHRSLNVAFLHSGIDSVSRMHVLEAMKEIDVKDQETKDIANTCGPLDVVVGVNLLREGIDLPAVQLVAILDADSEGFLRGETALIQTIGRAARNVRGHVVMYADSVTCAMQRAIDETSRRRRLQSAYNSLHGIHPTSAGGQNDQMSRLSEPLLERIRKMKIKDGGIKARNQSAPLHSTELNLPFRPHFRSPLNGTVDVNTLRNKMIEAAKAEDFETASLLRDQLKLIGGFKS